MRRTKGCQEEQLESLAAAQENFSISVCALGEVLMVVVGDELSQGEPQMKNQRNMNAGGKKKEKKGGNLEESHRNDTRDCYELHSQTSCYGMIHEHE
tara:strand:+ start:353 stop:643 length:291 start_codon:yes stop_codon:yes gene_type:complete